MPGAGTSTANQNVAKTSAESGTTSNTQAQTANTNTGPWGATQPLLGSIIGSLNGLSGNTSPSPQQSEAVANLQGSANAIPNFGDAAANSVNPLLNGTYSGMLTGALNDYKTTLSPYLSSSYLNPMTTPGLSDALGTVKSDVTNQVNDQFAAAGRDLSPANTTALARGISQGEAPIIADQYNRNVAAQQGAAGALYGAGASTPGMLSNLTTSGIGAAGALPSLYTAPASAELGAANAGYALPYSNLGMLSGLTLPIAGLGQTSSSSSTGTNNGSYSGTGNSNSVGNSSQNMSPLGMLASLFGGGGSASGLGSAIGNIPGVSLMTKGLGWG